MQIDRGFFYKILYKRLFLKQQLKDNFDGVDIRVYNIDNQLDAAIKIYY